MKDYPLVSIIINNYNYGCFLGEAIASALNQTYSPIEVIVVDDGSTDNSLEIIASYKDQIISVLKENGGQASAFNAGFAASQGDIICLLDSDDSFLAEKVEEIVEVFRCYPDIGWCFHSLKLLDNSGIFIKKSHESSSQEWDFISQIKSGRKLPYIPTATSGLCFTRSILNQILPMPEASNVIISDNYLKFTALGLSKGYFLNKELAIQKIHGNNAYTLMKDKQKIDAQICLNTAYWIRVKFPSFYKFTNGLFITAIGLYWGIGGVDSDSSSLVNSYLSSFGLLERAEIKVRVLYHCLKYEITSRLRWAKNV